jgi:pSer/pThr/pTyr-binding forkhead associated (FHA) protein
MKIGRKAGCDIVLEDALVSGEHALVKTVGMKSSIQDLDSTNGTFVEDKRVTHHALRHGETVIIGGHSLIYRDDVNLEAPAFGKRPGSAPSAQASNQNVTTEIVNFSYLVAGDGRDKSKNIPLIKTEMTIGSSGKGSARITRTSNGYLLEAAMGPGEPTLNGRPVPPGGQILESDDVIDVLGTKYKFSG